MKRFLALLLVFALCFSLAACKKKSVDEDDNKDDSTTEDGSSQGGNTTGNNGNNSNTIAKDFNNVVYLKNNQLWYSDYTPEGTFELTEKLANFTITEDASLSQLFFEVYASDDGTKLFYPDRITYTEKGYPATYTLYCKDLTKKNSAPIMIADGVDSYTPSRDGTKVLYQQGSTLYIYDFKTATKIADNVSYGDAWEKDLSVIWYWEDSAFSIWRASTGQAETLCENGIIPYFSEDFSLLYVLEERAIEQEPTDDGWVYAAYTYNLYKYNRSTGAKELVDTDVADYLCSTDTGELYYAKLASSTEKSLSNFLIDDLQASDAAMVNPYANPNATSEDYDAWQDKQKRDNLRKQAATEKITLETYSIYQYDGNAKTKLTGSLAAYYYEDYSYAYVNDTPISVVRTPNGGNMIHIAEAASLTSWELEDRIIAGNVALLIGKDLVEIPVENADRALLTEDGSTLYITTKANEKSVCNLYKASIVGNTITNVTLVDTNLELSSYFDIHITLGNSICYYKNCTETGDLYLDGKLIDTNIPRNVLLYSTDDTLIYVQSSILQDRAYTLKLYKNGATYLIAEDVNRWDLLPNGDVLYMPNYDVTQEKGELYRYSNGTSTKVDSDVTKILSVANWSTLYG